jgi:hypothetical protein
VPKYLVRTVCPSTQVIIKVRQRLSTRRKIPEFEPKWARFRASPIEHNEFTYERVNIWPHTDICL